MTSWMPRARQLGGRVALLCCCGVMPGVAFAQSSPQSLDLGSEGEIVITGKVQKPEVIVVIRRENLDKGFVLELRETFLDRIIDAVKQPPF